MRTSRRSPWIAPLLLTLIGFGAACGANRRPERSAPAHDSATEARMAESLFKAGRISEALAAIERGIALDPTRPPLYHQRGMIEFRAGRLDQAEKTFLYVLEFDPYYTDARNFLGSIYHEQGRLAEAEEQYRKALEDRAYPTPELVHLNLAVLFEAQGRDEDALGHLRKSVELNPRYYQAHYELASTLDRMGKLDEAARIYEVAEPGYRGNAEYHYRVGLAYFKLGRADRSRESLRRSIDVAPGSESAARAAELLELLD